MKAWKHDEQSSNWFTEKAFNLRPLQIKFNKTEKIPDFSLNSPDEELRDK